MSEDMNLDDFVDSEISSNGGDFIETAAGKVPGDWSTTKVEQVCELRNGKATDHVEIGVEAYPVYGSNGPIGSYSEPNFDGGLIFGRVGAVGEVERVTEPVWVSDNAIQARVTDRINTEYLYYYLRNEELGALATKTAQPLLNQSTIGNVTVATPSLEEQRKIGSVLYTVDEAIEKTEQIIEQLQTVRRGTEQDVLSRGVREDGTLRGDDEIEYRSSWVGEIPQDWEVKQYRELISDSSVGIVVKPSQYYDDSGTVPILRSKDISADGIVDGDFEYMTEESNAENENSQLRKGDVITVRSGDPGLSCVVSSEFDGANCADLLISTPGPNLDPHYAAMWINSFAGRKQIDRFQAGLAQKHFNLGALRKLRVGVPSLDEQKRIVEKISSISESIEHERECKRQLQRLKQGLMQNLLSGEIRTADRDINIHPEVEKDE